MSLSQNTARITREARGIPCTMIDKQVLGKGFTEVKQDVRCGTSVRKSREAMA